MAQKIMLKINGGGGDEPEPTPVSNSNAVSSGIPGLPLYKPKDTNIVKLEDKRQINPATGKPFKLMGSKGINANEEDIRAIIAHAKAKGVDPGTALAIGLQETNLGQTDQNYGSAWSTFEDEGLPDDRNKNANILAKAIKDKMAYAQELRHKGLLPKGEEYDLQTYNGLGVLKPTLSVGGKMQDASYYEIPVTANNHLDLKKNPAYGKTVRQLRDEVIMKNPKIMDLISKTGAYGAPATTSEVPKKVMLKVKK